MIKFILITFGGMLLISILVINFQRVEFYLLITAMFLPSLGALAEGYINPPTFSLKGYLAIIPIILWISLLLLVTAFFIKPVFSPEFLIGILPSSKITLSSERSLTLLVISIAILPIAPLINSFFTFGEEYGWRGFLLQTLSRHLGWIKSSILIGFIWGLWHSPLIILTGYEYGLPFWLPGVFLFTILTIPLSIIQTWAYLRWGIWGSSFSHGAVNAYANLFYIFYPSTIQPPRWLYGPVGVEGSIIMSIIAILIIIIDKKILQLNHK
jgi:membrane protease YdiL (CAAX protease family)